MARGIWGLSAAISGILLTAIIIAASADYSLEHSASSASETGMRGDYSTPSEPAAQSLYGASGSGVRVDDSVMAAAERGEYANVIVTLKDPQRHEPPGEVPGIQAAEEQQSEVLSTIQEQDMQLRYQYKSFNGFSGRINRAALKQLIDSGQVESIAIDGVSRIFLDVSAPRINATNAWVTLYNSTNLTGGGDTICIIDTGVNYSHADMGACSVSSFTSGTCDKVIGGFDLVNNDADPMDDHGHGTHVAGIAASTNDTYRGMAPDARIIALKACNSAGSCSNSDVTAAIDWCVNNRTAYNITVISMSLGGGGYSTYCDANEAFYRNSINSAVLRNISVTVATGNDGSITQIAAPSCIYNSTAITSTTKADAISSFSNTNNLTDLAAPGSGIVSLAMSAGTISRDGTSMATPHAAGAFALISQFGRAKWNTTYHPEEIQRALYNTGRDVNDTGGNKLIYKRISVLDAIIYLDGSLPNATFIAGTPGNNTVLSAAVLAINISNNQTPTGNVLEWNGTTNYTMARYSNTIYSIILRNLSNGNVTYRVFTNNSLGKYGVSETRTLMISNTAPNITLSLPALASFSIAEPSNQTFNITFNESSNNDTATITWYVNGTNQTGNYNLTWHNFTGAYNTSGSYNITVTITDGMLWNSTTWIMDVNNTDREPVLNFTIQNQTIQEDTNLSFNITAYDLEGNPIRYYLNDTRFGISQTNGSINFTPPLNFNGTIPLNITASDGALNTSQTVIVTVAPANDPPIVSLVGNMTVNETDWVNVTITAADPDIQGDDRKIEEQANFLELGENLTSVKLLANRTDLPAILQNDTITNTFGTFAYEQIIELPKYAYVKFTNDTNNTAAIHNQSIPSDYLILPTNATGAATHAYTYRMNFTPFLMSSHSQTYHLTDLRNKQLNILGRRFQILEANHTAYGRMELRMMASDGKLLVINDTDTFTRNNGGTIAVDDNVPIPRLKADIIAINDSGLNDSTSNVNISAIEITYDPSQPLYVGSGDNASFVADRTENQSGSFLLGAFDFRYNGLAISSPEYVKVFPHNATNYNLTFTNKYGVNYNTFIFGMQGSNITLGSSASLLVLNESGNISDEGYFALTRNKTSRILQLKAISPGTSQLDNSGNITFRDTGTGSSITSNYSSLLSNITIDGSVFLVLLQGDNASAAIRVDMDGDGVAGNSSIAINGTNGLYTQNGAYITFPELAGPGSGGITLGTGNTTLLQVTTPADEDGQNGTAGVVMGIAADGSRLDISYINGTFDGNAQATAASAGIYQQGSSTVFEGYLYALADDNATLPQYGMKATWNKISSNATSQDSMNFTIPRSFARPSVSIISHPSNYLLNYTINHSAFTQNRNYSFTWKPNTTSQAKYSLMASVTDGNHTANMTFNVTVLDLIDSDGDGMPDRDDPDDDNDGISDADDYLTGANSSFMNTTNIDSSTINLSINGSTNLSQRFNQTVFVNITNGSIPLLEFYWNFTNQTLGLNFTYVSQPAASTYGAFLVKGLLLQENRTKNVTMLRVNSSITSICVKDSDSESINDISRSCNSTNETLITCPGTNSSYTCGIINASTDTFFKITGLKFSAGKQQCPDSDYDSYYASNCGNGTDCNDNSASISPGTAEVCGDGVDNDCSGGDQACPSSSGGGGGGGGSSGGTITPGTSQGAKVSYAFAEIAAGKENTMRISNPGISLSRITFITANPIGAISYTIESTPENQTKKAENAYQYLKITPSQELKESDYSSIDIQFKVNKSWISNNSIVKEKISLLRLRNSTYQQMPAEIMNESETAYTYTAKAPGFSYFAINGTRESSAIPQDEPGQGTNRTAQRETGESNTTGSQVSRDGLQQPSGKKQPPLSTPEAEPKNEQKPSKPLIGPETMKLIIYSAAALLAAGLIIIAAAKSRKLLQKIREQKDIMEFEGRLKAKQPAKENKDIIFGEQEEMDKYIIRAQRHGKQKAEIREELIKAGWDEAAVDRKLKRH